MTSPCSYARYSPWCSTAWSAHVFAPVFFLARLGSILRIPIVFCFPSSRSREPRESSTEHDGSSESFLFPFCNFGLDRHQCCPRPGQPHVLGREPSRDSSTSNTSTLSFRVHERISSASSIIQPPQHHTAHLPASQVRLERDQHHFNRPNRRRAGLPHPRVRPVRGPGKGVRVACRQFCWRAEIPYAPRVRVYQ